MTAQLPWPRLMVITNRHMTVDLPATVADALRGGARWILLREKDMPQSTRLDLARQLKGATDRHAAHLGINSDVAAALSVGAASLHLPAGQLHHKMVAVDRLLGVSVHDAHEADEAVAAGADYLLLAPIFATESKRLHRPPLGLSGLRAITDSVRVPVIALGGISPENALNCLDVGAAGIASMGVIMRAADPAATVEVFLKAMCQ